MLEASQAEAGFWANPDSARRTVQELKLLKEVIRGFERTFPDIKVDYQPIAGDYVPAMLAAMSSRRRMPPE